MGQLCMSKKNIACILIICFSWACSHKTELPAVPTPFTPNHITAKKKQVKMVRLAIAPYNEIDSVTTSMLVSELENFYSNLNAVILPKAVMSDSLLANSKTRYNANKILNYLDLIKPEEVTYILALTTDKIAACGDTIHETGVAGLGNRPGTCSVVSTWSLRRKLTDEMQFTQRLIKACMHEMGHNFGLSHCKNKDKKCLMRDAGGTILTLDQEDVHLCKKCEDLLKQKGIHLRKKEAC
jgi:archaemetzincin